MFLLDVSMQGKRAGILSDISAGAALPILFLSMPPEEQYRGESQSGARLLDKGVCRRAFFKATAKNCMVIGIRILISILPAGSRWK